MLAVALLVGAAAALLTGPITPTSSSASPILANAGTILAWVLTALVIGGLAIWIWNRWNNGALPVPARLAATALIAILLAIGFIVLAHLVGFGAVVAGGGGNATAPNQTGPGGNANGTNLTAGGGASGLFGVSLPFWAFYVVAALALVGVGFLAARLVPLGPKATRREVEDRRAARSAFADAARALEDPRADPREILIALYGRLLRRIEPIAPGLEVSTPEEIRRLHLVPLGVGRSSADTITRAFERARYSSHAIDPAEVGRVRAALAEAIADLDRSPREP